MVGRGSRVASGALTASLVSVAAVFIALTPIAAPDSAEAAAARIAASQPEGGNLWTTLPPVPVTVLPDVEDEPPAPPRDYAAERALTSAVFRSSGAFPSGAPPELAALVEDARSELADDASPTSARLLDLAEQIRTTSLNAQLAAVFEGGSGAAIVTDPATDTVIYALDADRQFVSASTYKVFVVYDMVRQIEEGMLSGDEYLDGMSVDSCIYEMVVYSQNECPQEWLYQRGYQHMQDVAGSVGATGTVFEFGNLQTTAADLAEVLGRLYRRELLDEAGTQRILHLMTIQEFRDGIPAGLGNSVLVANKVGWLDEVNHDAGIIYSPKGDFVLVIMTEYLSFDVVAEAAGVIYAWL